jgi:hypothetical protein
MLSSTIVQPLSASGRRTYLMRDSPTPVSAIIRLLKAVRIDPTCLSRRGPVRGPHMSHVYQRHSRMSLRPEQHFHIAAAYDKAAFDISLPAHTRAAFAKKADWFRLRARVGKKIEQAALSNPFGFIT